MRRDRENGRIRVRRVLASTIALLTLGLLIVAGCVRYARNVNLLYEPVAGVRGGSGDLYLVIPPDQQTPGSTMKWVIGTIKDDDGNTIDEIYSPYSPAELLQNALAQELKRAGYAVIPAVAPPAVPAKTLVLTRSEVALDQVSGTAGLRAACRLAVTLEVSKGGAPLKKLTYETTHSDTSVRDRDLVAREVLRSSLQAVMRKAVPDLVTLLETN